MGEGLTQGGTVDEKTGLHVGRRAAAAAISAPDPARAQAKPEMTKLALGFGLDPVFAPHMVAMQKGWFREAGFTEVSDEDVHGRRARRRGADRRRDPAVDAGQPAADLDVANGVPVVVLGTNCLASEADRLVARKDANVRTPEDLYNIKIGLLAGSTASAVLHYLAKHYKLDEKRLQVVNLPPPEQLAGLNSGNVQALLCWQPWGYNAVKGGSELIHTGTTSFFAANQGQPAQISYTRSLFVASQEFVRKNPIAVRAHDERAAARPAIRRRPENREEVVGLVARETKQDRALAEAIWDQYVFDPAFDERYVRDMRS